MKTLSITMCVLFFLTLSFAGETPPGPGHQGVTLQSPAMPIHFVPNQGQFHPGARYVSHTPGYSLWLTGGGLVFKQRRRGGGVMRMMFCNANSRPDMTPQDVTGHVVNDYRGPDPKNWRGGIPTSGAVLYKELYPGIHLKVYGKKTQVEYDWIVRPGGNPGAIRFRLAGNTTPVIEKNGDLVLKTHWSEWRHRRPTAFQETPLGPARRSQVNVSFKAFADGSFGYETGPYNRELPLVIDPMVMVYSTYLGGSDRESVGGMAADSQGNIYLTGETRGDDFPVYNNSLTYPGGDSQTIGFVAKLGPYGQPLYSTYFGGTASDRASGLTIDGNGNAYVSGYTYSTGFPVLNGYQEDINGLTEGYIAKFSSTGQLVFSTLLGGSGMEQLGPLALGTDGSIYVCGTTSSSDFPGAAAASRDSNCFVAKLSSNGKQLLYSYTMDNCTVGVVYGIAVDGSGSAYVGGTIYENTLPVKNAFQATYNNGEDGFLIKLSSAGDQLVYATYLSGATSATGGNTATDAIYDVTVDSQGRAYVTGETSASDFPLKNPYQSTMSGGDAFVTIFSADGSQLEYSTVLGGTGLERGTGIQLDADGIIHLTGTTRSSNFPVKDAYQSQGGGDLDQFYARLSANGSKLLSSTYLGGTGWDQGGGLAVDSTGANAWLFGTTDSTDFPVLNAFQDTFTGTWFDCTVTRFYNQGENEEIPEISLDRNTFYFAAEPGGSVTGAQVLHVSNSGGGTLNWQISGDSEWLKYTPASGTTAEITLWVEPGNLAAGSYTGQLEVTSFLASNAPQLVTVHLNVLAAGADTPPFGTMDLPNQTEISGSVAFSGWALDDIGIEHVAIYRQVGSNRYPVGAAMFVAGARTDIESQYPTYPLSYAAGWGYMMLTNALPNGGNGTFTFVAVATGVSGQETVLGTKTVQVNNTDSIIPFGSIDLPAMGERISGSAYRNIGWALTPNPDSLNGKDGAVEVFIDNKSQGYAIYGQPRPDVAALFPGYLDEVAPGAYLDIDTAAFEDGMHTIHWIVTDTGGDVAGLGSRYIYIDNTSSSRGGRTLHKTGTAPVRNIMRISRASQPDASTLWYRYAPAAAPKDWSEWKPVLPGDTGKNDFIIRTRPMQWLEIGLWEKPSGEFTVKKAGNNETLGIQRVGNLYRPLPVGGTLDRDKGIFSWTPGPGFMGSFHLVFLKKQGKGSYLRKTIVINIQPGTGN